MSNTIARYLALGRRSMPTIVLLVPLAVLIVLPIGMLILTSFLDAPPRPGAPLGNLTLEHYRALWTEGTRAAVSGTAVIAFFGTVLALAIGGALAWIATRTDAPWRGLTQLAGVVPLFISSLVGALAWALIGSPNAGYANTLLGDLGLPRFVNLYSKPGIIFVFGLYYAPYAFVFLSGALSLMNPEMEEAGSVHGGTRPAVARRITFPLVAPALLASGLLTFVLIAENFPVVQVLGLPANVESLPARIFRLIVATPGEPNRAAAIGVMLMVFVFAGVAIQNLLLRRRSFVTVSGKGFRPRRIALGRWRYAAVAFSVGYFVVAVLLPLFALVQSSLRRHQYIGSFADLFDLSALGLVNIREVADYEAFRTGMVNSVIVATGAALGAGVLFFAASVVVHKTNSPGRRLLTYVVLMPLAMPALVIGMGFLWTWTRSPIPVYGTLAMLMIAFVARFAPQGYQGISSTMVQLDKDLEESAYTLGAGRLRASKDITFPLIKSGVMGTVFLVFILAFRELSVAILLFTTDTRILSVVIYDQWENGRWPRVATMSLAYSAVLLLVAVVGRRLFKIGRAGPS